MQTSKLLAAATLAGATVSASATLHQFNYPFNAAVSMTGIFNGTASSDTISIAAVESFSGKQRSPAQSAN